MCESLKPSRRATTLLELLVAVGIIGVLVGLTASAVQAVRSAAARLACANNLRQLGLAAQHHHEAAGVLPRAYSRLYAASPYVGWPVEMLPFLDQKPLWDRTVAAYRLSPRPWVVPPHSGLVTVVPTYACPADGRVGQPVTDRYGETAAYLSYAGVAGGFGALDGVIFDARGCRLADVTDGSSQTLLFGERPPWGERAVGNWYTQDGPLEGPLGFGWAINLPTADPGPYGRCQGPFGFGPGRFDNPCDTYHFWSLHGGGANWAFCDGSVRFLSYAARPLVVPLATRAGGEVVQMPD